MYVTVPNVLNQCLFSRELYISLRLTRPRNG